MGKLIDLTGQKFGRLTVVKHAYNRNKKTYWVCLCDCGNYVTVRADCLKDGNTKSCGCMNNELRAQFGKSHLKHGDAQRGDHKRLHQIWASMKDRCKNQKSSAYKYYGAKGVKVCADWHEYENFKKWALENGYKKDLSIDRIDVNGDYCPENCRWVTHKEQMNNTTRNRIICFNGKEQTISQWSEETGINRDTLNNRLGRLGWSVEKAMTTPPQIQRGKNTEKG